MQKTNKDKQKAKSEKRTPNQPQSKKQANDSYWEMMVNGIVRPPRAHYHQNHLGNKIIHFRGNFFVKNDHQISHSEKKIDLTTYICKKESPYIVLYMHGNSSCRMEALSLIKYLPPKIGLACFDFMGCGKNQQMDTISLGHRESDQAATVVEFLRKQGHHVILWGRSMGAATALLYGKADFIVADSSYKSFKSLCKQIAKEHSPVVVPNCMISCFFPCVFSKLKKDIDKKAQYDVEDLDVKEAVKRLHPDTTVVFMSGDKDALILPRNSQKLHDICPCKEKYIKIFDGDHNSKRPESIMQEVVSIIDDYIGKFQKKFITHEEIKFSIEPTV